MQKYFFSLVNKCTSNIGYAWLCIWKTTGVFVFLVWNFGFWLYWSTVNFYSRRQWVREEDLAKDLKLHTKQLRRTLRFFEEEKIITRDHRREVTIQFCPFIPLLLFYELHLAYKHRLIKSIRSIVWSIVWLWAHMWLSINLLKFNIFIKSVKQLPVADVISFLHVTMMYWSP